MADDDEEEPIPCTWRKQKPKKVPGDEEEEEDDDEELPQGDRDENGVPIGDGVMTYPDGAKFVGTLISGGLREGKGVYTFAKDRGSYEGTYKNNIKDGMGKFIYPDKSSYEGAWVQDKRCGEGVYKYANGDVYKGGWEGDVKSGQGSYFFKASKSTFMGSWVKGKFTEGEWILKDGTIFKGKFKNNKPLEGSFTFSKNGNVTTGKFDKHGFFIEDQTSIQEETKPAAAQ